MGKHFKNIQQVWRIFKDSIFLFSVTYNQTSCTKKQSVHFFINYLSNDKRGKYQIQKLKRTIEFIMTQMQEESKFGMTTRLYSRQKTLLLLQYILQKSTHVETGNNCVELMQSTSGGIQLPCYCTLMFLFNKRILQHATQQRRTHFVSMVLKHKLILPFW